MIITLENKKEITTSEALLKSDFLSSRFHPMHSSACLPNFLGLSSEFPHTHDSVYQKQWTRQTKKKNMHMQTYIHTSKNPKLHPRLCLPKKKRILLKSFEEETKMNIYSTKNKGKPHLLSFFLLLASSPSLPSFHAKTLLDTNKILRRIKKIGDIR